MTGIVPKHMCEAIRPSVMDSDVPISQMRKQVWRGYITQILQVHGRRLASELPGPLCP